MVFITHMSLISESSIRAGIHDHTTAYIVSENSWPTFIYKNYQADAKNLEHGLFKSKLLVMVSSLIFPTDLHLIISQGFKAIFTSLSSANEVDGNDNSANIIKNNQCAQRQLDQARVKTCAASIIGMRKVTPHVIMYATCQVIISTHL
jgi:hypothetical protein